MKTLFFILMIVILTAVSQTSYAAPAVVTALTGSAQLTPQTGSPRNLKNGDPVNEGDTVSTSRGSSLVLLFEDGHIAAIGASSRMIVSAYTYNAKEPAKSNVLLSLVVGGMRSLTGLIGKVNPAKVNFRVGTATIGIRGTDVILAVEGNNVVVTVRDGAISFTLGGKTVNVPAGQAALGKGGTFTTGTAGAIQAAANRQSPALAGILANASSEALQAAVAAAAAKAAADKAAADKAAADKAAADKAAADKAAADKAAADKAAADKAAADKAAADKAAADKAAADSKAAADKAAADKAAADKGAADKTNPGAGTIGSGGGKASGS